MRGTWLGRVQLSWINRIAVTSHLSPTPSTTPPPCRGNTTIIIYASKFNTAQHLQQLWPTFCTNRMFYYFHLNCLWPCWYPGKCCVSWECFSSVVDLFNRVSSVLHNKLKDLHLFIYFFFCFITSTCIVYGLASWYPGKSCVSWECFSRVFNWKLTALFILQSIQRIEYTINWKIYICFQCFFFFFVSALVTAVFRVARELGHGGRDSWRESLRAKRGPL